MAKIKLVANVHIKVLVVEDDADLSAVIERELTTAGFEVVCVSRGSDARDALTDDAYDLVLCDWKLPDFGGLDLLGFVRMKIGIPFILMTGFADFIEKEDVYQSGAAVFLSKPFDRTILHAAVSKALNLEESLVQSLQESLKRG